MNLKNDFKIEKYNYMSWWNFKKSEYWFYYQHDQVKQNYIANLNRKQILETWRTQPSVFDHVLINNLYSDAWFIFAVIIAILIKVFLLKKSFFVNEQKNKNLEYEYYLINFAFCSFVLLFLFLNNKKLWYVVVIWIIAYLIFLYKEQIKVFIQQLKEDRTLNLDMSQIQIEEERELLSIKEMKDNEILETNVWVYTSMWPKVLKSILLRYIWIFISKFFSKLNIYLYIILVIWFIYLLFLLIWLYIMWSNEWLIKITN